MVCQVPTRVFELPGSASCLEVSCLAQLLLPQVPLGATMCLHFFPPPSPCIHGIPSLLGGFDVGWLCEPVCMFIRSHWLCDLLTMHGQTVSSSFFSTFPPLVGFQSQLSQFDWTSLVTIPLHFPAGSVKLLNAASGHPFGGIFQPFFELKTSLSANLIEMSGC